MGRNLWRNEAADRPGTRLIDTLLTATALEHELFLAIRNTRDVLHSGAAIFNPWDDDPVQFPLA